MSKADAFDAAMSGCSTGGRTDNVQRFLAGLRGDKDYWPQYGIEEADKKLADRFEDALKNPKVSTASIKRTLHEIGFHNIAEKSMNRWRRENNVKG